MTSTTAEFRQKGVKFVQKLLLDEGGQDRHLPHSHFKENRYGRCCAVSNDVGFCGGAFSSVVKVACQAARSMTVSVGLSASVCQPSTLRMVICPEASSAPNRCYGVGGRGLHLRRCKQLTECPMPQPIDLSRSLTVLGSGQHTGRSHRDEPVELACCRHRSRDGTPAAEKARAGCGSNCWRCCTAGGTRA